MIALSLAVRNARLASISQALDAAVNPGLLRIYTGLRPVLGEALGDRLLLVEVRLPKPCTASLANGVLTFAPIARTLCRHSGAAAWARLLDGAEHIVMDLDVGLPDSGAELELHRLDLLAGGAVDITLGELVE